MLLFFHSSFIFSAYLDFVLNLASFYNSHSFSNTLPLFCLSHIHVTTDQHLHDLHTLHLFISGRDKKTSSSISRSSSGFESSHLPSPEYPALPLTSTSSSKTSLQSKPGCLPCILPSLRPSKNSLSLLSPAKGHLPSGAIARSQSCMELRRNPAPGLLRRSFSLSALHKEQKGKLINPKKWNLTPSVSSEESTQHTVNPQKHREVMSPPSQSPSTSYNAVCITLNKDTSPKQAETTQSTHLQLPPTVPAGRSNHPLITPSLPNPHREPLLTETACTHDYTNHMSSELNRSHSISANSEARRLKMKRNKKTSINPVNLGSLIEERL